MASKKSSSGAIAHSTAEYDWQAENDLDTMIKSEEIEKDPKRLAKVQALAKKKMMGMAAIASESASD